MHVPAGWAGGFGRIAMWGVLSLSVALAACSRRPANEADGGANAAAGSAAATPAVTSRQSGFVKVEGTRFVADRQHHRTRAQRAPGCKHDALPAIDAHDIDRGIGQMHDAIGPWRGRERGAEVVRVGPACRELPPGCRLVRAARGPCIQCSQMAHEVQRIGIEGAHPGRDDVEQVLAPACGVRNPFADLRARLQERDSQGRGRGMQQVDRDQRACGAGADDHHVERRLKRSVQ